MRKRNDALILIPVAALALVAGCSRPSAPFDDTPFKMGEHILEFDSLEEDSKVSWISNGYSNNGMFRSYWSKDRVNYKDGIGYLSLVDIDDKNYGAEIRTKEGYLYGYFGARMKTFKRSGTVQSVFTYNGGPQYIWDEIDIEILGKNTREVQFNY